MLCEYRITLEPQDIETANPKSRAVLEKALEQVGFIPNMYAYMVNSPGLLDSYLHGYAAFRSESGFTPPEQEVIFLAISREHGCEYCVSAHSMLADVKSLLDPAVTDAIRDDTAIPDPRLAALAEFTRIMVRSRGLPSHAEVMAFLEAEFKQRHILEVVLAIAVKTLSNYANHLCHTPLDSLFESRRWTDATVYTPGNNVVRSPTIGKAGRR
ncbi:carboxymuconolactone decarboxylase family protein [Sedimenticola hydrogenitrophicus]|uniref:carboxymuconolactone decarboxylase family protein n=1 Tax=Sedimenticola hydrogenitrophicus TaxID=2967975 RepID=UPI0023B0C248|nr:carboxymuconolactone decarboxylase family protein [Sedimenticola hydrogenitrophicus]